MSPDAVPPYMNPVLAQIIEARTCTTSNGKNVHLLQNMAEAAEGALIHKCIAAVQATTTLDIGLGYGASSMFICDALKQIGSSNPQHIAIDPSQHDQTFQRIGLHNVHLAGCKSTTRTWFIIEQPL